MTASIPESVISTARYLVTFDRVGRHHQVPPLQLDASDIDELLARIRSYTRPYLASRIVEVFISPDIRRGFIACGMQTGGTFTVVDREPWHQPCDQPWRRFQHGVRVRHRNPALADWRGIVEPAATGEHRGKCMRLSAPFDGDPLVHVRWTRGTTDAGWYDVTCIAVATDGAR